MQPPPDKSAQHRVAVLQPGARLHYAVPALLARAGMLEQLYTDIYAPRWANAIPPALLPRTLARLVGRSVPSEIRGRVASVPLATLLARTLDLIRAAGVPAPRIDVQNRLHQTFLRDAIGRATALYVVVNEDLELARRAKDLGVKIISEQMANPHVGRILAEERALFPGLEEQDDPKEIEIGIARDEALWNIADLVISPSDFVKRDILIHGVPSSRVALVPYGISEEWLQRQSRPVCGRILFVGSVGLRKGNHYLAEATRLLQARGVKCDVRVIGPFDSRAIGRAEFKGPTYVGQVPRSIVHEEFASADLFVLPTISDSFALVHLEALACGVPVITTPNCGSVVQDGVEGFIVPIRDPIQLADRMQLLLEDRALRERMSVAARARAREFTWARFADRLLAAIRAALG